VEADPLIWRKRRGEVKDGNRRRPHSIGNEKENELGFSTLEMNSIEVKNY
jgi:hypothetical protein